MGKALGVRFLTHSGSLASIEFDNVCSIIVQLPETVLGSSFHLGERSMVYCSVGVLLAVGLAGIAMSAVAGEPLAPLSTFKDCDHCPEMVVIPAGKFLRGSAEDEPSRTTWEEPQHEVTFAKPFAIGKYEVTFDEWDACVLAGGCPRT